jgi:hypothetical protein
MAAVRRESRGGGSTAVAPIVTRDMVQAANRKQESRNRESGEEEDAIGD